MRKIWEWINEMLYQLRGCFGRKEAFNWFVIVIMGLMLRTEHTGITAIMRVFGLDERVYEAMIHFFHSRSWRLASIQEKWTELVWRSGALYRENEEPILIGDGVKHSKEARRMPGVKRQHQESENSSKGEYMFGHLFGGIGILVGNAKKLFCVPLSMTMQDGDDAVRRFENEEHEGTSHVVAMIRNALEVMKGRGRAILLLDAYFLSVPALREMAHNTLMTLVTRAKLSTVAYEEPGEYKGRGRPCKKGAAVKLKELFKTEAFVQTDVYVYGKKEKVRYLCKDLLWGKGWYQELRFILVQFGNIQSILVCTNLSFTPEQIIRLYGYRFKIEVTFRALKQVIGGFSYHFWSRSMPKLNRFAKKGAPDPIEKVSEKKQQSAIVSALKAIEGYVMFSCIAIGLLQLIAVRFSQPLQLSRFRFLRTVTNNVVSEATVSEILRKSFFLHFHNNLHLGIMHIIQAKIPPFDDSSRSIAS